MKLIESHANRYYQLLESSWEETDWSEIEAHVVLDRMKNILDQLPAAERQAHERIIGERRVVAESIGRIDKEYGAIKSYTADRGFDSPENAIDLEKLNIINGICPRSVSELEKRLADETFRRLQTRRDQPRHE
jgi:hypothetical protein